MKRSNLSGKAMAREDNGIAWELRPGGMLVQKRSDAGGGPSGPVIKIKVTHGSYHHDLSILAQSTFGELKRVLAQETGLAPSEQRLLFRGKEKDDGECLHMAGIKDMSKVVLLEDPASKEQKLERMRRDQGMLRACEAVAAVRAEVDKLAVKVSNLEASVHVGAKAADKDFSLLTELLMVQLLKLDSIEAQGEAKVQRRFEDVADEDRSSTNTLANLHGVTYIISGCQMNSTMPPLMLKLTSMVTKKRTESFREERDKDQEEKKIPLPLQRLSVYKSVFEQCQ